MKRNFYSLVICFTFLLTGSLIKGQTSCNVDTTFTTNLSFTPNPIPCAFQGIPYDQDITFVLPNDTVFLGFPAPFTEHTIIAVDDLPNGLTYACNQANCTYPVNAPTITRGCLRITGTPTALTNPMDSVKIRVRSSIQTFLGVIDTVNTLNVHICVLTGTEEALAAGYEADILPNPSQGDSRLQIYLPKPGRADIRLYDALGREVKMIHSGDLQRGKHTFEIQAEGLSQGLYYIRMNMDEGQMGFTRKFLLSSL